MSKSCQCLPLCYVCQFVKFVEGEERQGKLHKKNFKEAASIRLSLTGKVMQLAIYQILYYMEKIFHMTLALFWDLLKFLKNYAWFT